MKKIIFFLGLSWLFSTCSTGEKALKKGDHYEAVTTALSRLQKKSSDEKAQAVLENAYPLFVKENEQKISSYLNLSLIHI